MPIKLYQSALARTAWAGFLLLADSAAQALPLGAEQLAGLSAVGLEAPIPALAPTVPSETAAVHSSAAFSEATGKLLKPLEDQVAQSETLPVSDPFSQMSEAEIRQQLLITPAAEPIALSGGRPQPVPSSSFLTPAAYGADGGDVFAGVAVATDNQRGNFNGSASVGFGVGDAANGVGLEMSAGVFSGLINSETFADDGVAGFKLHRAFPSANLAIALGWANPIKWGAAKKEEDTVYGVATAQFDLRPNQPNSLPLTVSLGAGTGAFRSTGAIAAKNNAPNVFGSVSLRVQPEISVISSWTGSTLGLATSVAPFEFPLVVTVGLTDVTSNTADGIRLIGSVGYGYSF